MPPVHKNTVYREAAFTLIELSIVLVVIGLIFGGVLMGSSMIDAARMRSITKKYGEYFEAFDMFKKKYGGIPGDLYNATSFWTAATNCAPADGTGVCNGGGNGKVASGQEAYQAWRHLGEAKMIEGSYTGNPSDSDEVAKPKTSYDGVYFHVWNEGTAYYGGKYLLRNVIAIRSVNPGSAVLTPSQAYGLDAKLDDGIPSSGKIFSRVSSSNCHNGPDDMTDGVYQYTVANNSPSCSLEMVLPY